MTTIEKIKAEIERQIKDPQEYCYGISSVNKLRELLDFLSTLESEKPVPNDLEEAAKKHSCYDEDCEGAWYEPVVRNAFIAGAKWQKEQMMNEAVEGEAHPDDCEIWVNLVGYGYKFNDGDKVRIIIFRPK